MLGMKQLGVGIGGNDEDRKRNTDTLMFFRQLGLMCPVLLNQEMGFLSGVEISES